MQINPADNATAVSLSNVLRGEGRFQVATQRVVRAKKQTPPRSGAEQLADGRRGTEVTRHGKREAAKVQAPRFPGTALESNVCQGSDATAERYS